MLTGALIWHMALGILAHVGGMVAMLPRTTELEARLEERAETAEHLWVLYKQAHCEVKRLEVSVNLHLWPADSWPDGDPSGIGCPTDPKGGM